MTHTPADPELLASIKELVEREKLNRASFVECNTIIVDGVPDLTTLDEVEWEILADYDTVIAKAEAAISKAQGGAA